jgi:hypothetical protein
MTASGAKAFFFLFFWSFLGDMSVIKAAATDYCIATWRYTRGHKESKNSVPIIVDFSTIGVASMPWMAQGHIINPKV